MLSNRPQPSVTVRNRSQPSATVRTRSWYYCMAVPIGSFPGVVIFGRFTCHVASFRMAGVALRDIWTCCVTGRKSFCVAGTYFRGRRSTLDMSSVMFRGRRSTSDVSCCVFVGNRIGTAVRSADRVQIAWQALHFVTCAHIWRKASQCLWGKLENLRLGEGH